MDTVDLKEYFDIVVNMEKNIYLQNRLIYQKKNRFIQLGQARDSKQNLEKIYSLIIIFSKYHNLSMVCSINEYICTGR